MREDLAGSLPSVPVLRPNPGLAYESSWNWKRAMPLNTEHVAGKRFVELNRFEMCLGGLLWDYALKTGY